MPLESWLAIGVAAVCIAAVAYMLYQHVKDCAL